MAQQKEILSSVTWLQWWLYESAPVTTKLQNYLHNVWECQFTEFVTIMQWHKFNPCEARDGYMGLDFAESQKIERLLLQEFRERNWINEEIWVNEETDLSFGTFLSGKVEPWPCCHLDSAPAIARSLALFSISSSLCSSPFK